MSSVFTYLRKPKTVIVGHILLNLVAPSILLIGLFILARHGQSEIYYFAGLAFCILYTSRHLPLFFPVLFVLCLMVLFGASYVMPVNYFVGLGAYILFLYFALTYRDIYNSKRDKNEHRLQFIYPVVGAVLSSIAVVFHTTSSVNVFLFAVVLFYSLSLLISIKR